MTEHNAFHQELNADAPTLPGDHNAADDQPITIHDLAVYRLEQLGRSTEQLNGQDFHDVHLQIMGGCADCHASLAAFNAFPSRSGVWKCEDDIGDDGWTDVAEAHADIRAMDSANAGEVHDPLDEALRDDELDEDGVRNAAFADPGGNSALRAASSRNPRNLPCPDCGAPNRLTPADRAKGYRCDSCADRSERGMDY